MEPSIRRDVRGAWLKRFGLDHDMGDRLQDAQHALQATWQKLGIESARKDPYCDGYYFWSLIDCVFANELGWTGKVDEENPAYMAQGLFNPFCEEKSCGQTATGFASFNSPSGVFIDATPTHLHLVAGEGFSFDVLFAHYGERAYAASTVRWEIVNADGVSLSSGTRAAGRQELGSVRPIASFSPVAPSVERPQTARLVVCVEDGEEKTVSSWPCWLFPTRARRDGRDIAVVGACREALRRAMTGSCRPSAQTKRRLS